MTSITEALALYDTAGRIDRLRFQVRAALPPAPEIPKLAEVSAQAHTLAQITLAISDNVNHHLADGLSSVHAKKAVHAYSQTLALLGEVTTELGQLQVEITRLNFAAPTDRNDPVRRQRANQNITLCCQTADEILDDAARHLRTAATELAPQPTRTQAAARARAPHFPAAGPAEPTPVAPPAPAAPAAAPSTAKGR